MPGKLPCLYPFTLAVQNRSVSQCELFRSVPELQMRWFQNRSYGSENKTVLGTILKHALCFSFNSRITEGCKYGGLERRLEDQVQSTVNVEIFAFFASETISRVKIFARGSHVIPGQRPRKCSRGVYFRGKDLNLENSENFHVYSIRRRHIVHLHDYHVNTCSRADLYMA